MPTIEINYENDAEAWWNAARAHVSSSASSDFDRLFTSLDANMLTGLLGGKPKRLDVSQTELESFLAVARMLPQWDSRWFPGRHPVRITT
jgi:hypothetical protein